MSIERGSQRAAASRPTAPEPGPDPGGPPGPAMPYRMTVTTRQSHAEAVALADQCLGSWLKHEGFPEPPPASPAEPPPLPEAPPAPRSEPPPASSPGRAPVQPPPEATRSTEGTAPTPVLAERIRLADRVLLDRDDGPLPATPGAAPGQYTRRRLRLPAPHGTYQLTLTVATERDGPSWLCLEAEHLPASPGLRTPARVPVPDLVHRLLPLLDALDGPAEVRPHPLLITAGEVDGLIDELCDPTRRLPTVVASVPADLDPRAWTAEVLHPLLTGVTGLAVGYILDPGARIAFNIALEYHTVYGGAVRTYLPEVDPASRRDALRHLVLPRHRIEGQPRRAAALLAREPRRLAALAPLPEPLARVPVLRVRPSQRRPAPSLRPPVPPAVELTELVEELTQAQQAGADELQRVRRSLHRSWRRELHLRAENELQGTALRRVSSQLRALNSRLCPPGEAAPDPAGLLAETPTGPVNFAELLGRIGEFPLLSFTGDEKETLALENRTVGGNWVRLTWEGLTALQEYATVAVLGAAGGDFKQWCERAWEGGSRFPPRKAVRGESRTVCSHAKMRRERMFVVPSSVDPSGRAFMGAHLRIGGGRTAPRLHYLDDCSGSGRIYVGYIGMHLTNTMTN
ncbi:hypothetical protein E6W39_27680 [Kitasatospora acidiphila]|uniref:Uncharacterized protein n=1 Tax=Kitasatospora acidiphila TaxID=2567942 RepID=A0A540WAA3_9ACTN|nr:hypothetical protein [Kitasatospora acidiphila]TQF05324.1 hypothetical protein E6W39_27680 [Kitasatospora acidiphila]